MHVDLIKYKCTVYLGYSEQCTDRDPWWGGRLGDVGAGSFLDSSRGGSEDSSRGGSEDSSRGGSEDSSRGGSEDSSRGGRSCEKG